MVYDMYIHYIYNIRNTHTYIDIYIYTYTYNIIMYYIRYIYIIRAFLYIHGS